MPQITLDWPESARMGFETVLAAGDLGYAGLPFNWVTMPDQFTFAALDRLLRTASDDRPLFAQLALGSSHAPWVPVPDLVPWEEIGDGTIFNAMALSGDPPDVSSGATGTACAISIARPSTTRCASFSTTPRAMPPIRR
jgi:hypothetical protein